MGFAMAPWGMRRRGAPIFGTFVLGAESTVASINLGDQIFAAAIVVACMVNAIPGVTNFVEGTDLQDTFVFEAKVAVTFGDPAATLLLTGAGSVFLTIRKLIPILKSHARVPAAGSSARQVSLTRVSTDGQVGTPWFDASVVRAKLTR